MYSLGIDIGGTGCKCVAFTADGVQHALAYKEYNIPTGATTLSPGILKESVLCVHGKCLE